MIAGRCNSLIDIKLTDEPERVAGAVVYLIEQYDLTGSSLIQSFSPRVLAEIRKLNEDIGIGQILSVSAGRLDQLDVDFYTINQTMLTESFVRTARRQGRQIWVWTVNSKQNIRTVLSYDINGIITDYPQRVLEVGGFGALIDDQTPVPLLTEESTPAEM
jgi:glycerophosphoryl diester phosphodiesterase